MDFASFRDKVVDQFKALMEATYGIPTEYLPDGWSNDTVRDIWDTIGGVLAFLFALQFRPSAPVIGDYTPTILDTVLYVNAAYQSVVLTLPSAATYPGKVYHVKAIDLTNSAKVAAATGEYIDGVSEYNFILVNDSLMLVSDGTMWRVL